MLLHDAVKAARKDLGLTQKKLADLAGIQRRQLATLESGGNITLATLRKVLAQLPNLESFTLDVVAATVRRDVPPSEQQAAVAKAIELMQSALMGLTAATREGRSVGEREMAVFDRATEVMYSGLGYTAEDIRREYERIRMHHLNHPETAQGPAGEFVNAVETAALEVELERTKDALRAEGIDPDAVLDVGDGVE